MTSSTKAIEHRGQVVTQIAATLAIGIADDVEAVAHVEDRRHLLRRSAGEVLPQPSLKFSVTDDDARLS